MNISSGRKWMMLLLAVCHVGLVSSSTISSSSTNIAIERDSSSEARQIEFPRLQRPTRKTISSGSLRQGKKLQRVLESSPRTTTVAGPTKNHAAVSRASNHGSKTARHPSSPEARTATTKATSTTVSSTSARSPASHSAPQKDQAVDIATFPHHSRASPDQKGSASSDKIDPSQNILSSTAHQDTSTKTQEASRHHSSSNGRGYSSDPRSSAVPSPGKMDPSKNILASTDHTTSTKTQDHTSLNGRASVRAPRTPGQTSVPQQHSSTTTSAERTSEGPEYASTTTTIAEQYSSVSSRNPTRGSENVSASKHHPEKVSTPSDHDSAAATSAYTQDTPAALRGSDPSSSSTVSVQDTDTAHGNKPKVASIYPAGTMTTTTDDSSPPDNIASCGDGILDHGEECDFGEDNGYGYCTLDCLWMGVSKCGNGIVEEYEECDEGISYNGHGTCTLDCLSCDHKFGADDVPTGPWENGTVVCDDGEIGVLMWLSTDAFAPTENAVFLFDSTSPLDDAIWMHDVGAFQRSTIYEWAACVPADVCYEFYLFDTFMDGFVGDDEGLYLEADGEVLLDLYPGDVGTYYMYEEYWGKYFGSCKGDILQPSGPVWPHGRSPMEPAPTELIADIENCTAPCVEVVLNYTSDEYAVFQNALFLFDADTPPDDFIWAYETGSFVGQTNYSWTAFVETSRCTEFYFYDIHNDGLNSGSLTLTVDEVEALSILPGDNGTMFEGSQYWGVAFGDCNGSRVFNGTEDGGSI